MAEVVINKPRDPNTLSNYNNFRTTHTSTNFDILFNEQKLSGTVTHTLESITKAEAHEIILDTSHVQIKQVKVNDQSAKWELAPRMEPYGSALKVKLDKPVALHDSITLAIDVDTTAACTALQWLTPAQTSNKKHPYMFSQCQAIHARSIFPCQDTPDVKATFDFTVNSPLPVIASGIAASSNPDTSSADGNAQTYKFEQKVPIPAYLFAIASGDLSFASVGPRSTVATGPDELQECKWELEADTEKYLKAGESLVYPYAWGEYNVLVLPPSFPYGGMENPIYTFATPTIISGDRQNVDVIAHELSHSWSGNLVSNASWEHFWLNEGWTTYLERRIQAIVHGGNEWRDFSAIIGWKALSDSIAQYGDDHEFTKLVIDLKGKDPDDAFSSIPYEKGFVFLYYLEKLLGQESFDEFIPHYFTVWKGKSLDSYDFKATLLDFFSADKHADEAKKLDQVDWDTWFYSPGFPKWDPKYDTKLVDPALRLAKHWYRFTNPDDPASWGPTWVDVDGWSANQMVVFLEQVLAFDKPLPAAHANYMGAIYNVKDTRNVEVSSRYLQVAMAAGDWNVHVFVTELLGRVGRMKFVRPLYRGLVKMGAINEAVACFEKNKDFYHPICRQMIVKEIFGKTGHPRP
ncbi:leukotriene A-4 hydrolase/aminopeptidase [Cyphellophora europaea CBS 101466]|uniref:soluble epoxide hydrolase n=1 Tax=Cyphellophora europaea (strain CBS 101466) TaxID=1220924 RepID=W2RMY0_CYPE1|nr:leukotriene A-4 hydrolase/aminopeptidase [Cyphellophora europaea CBS 101466]ETN37058.1 leukotriene A-4 hydrolase/aminopeptidase [Cyphellophora europaea CBS 101466]